MPSRTEVKPVDPGLLPRTEEERERCARTVYVSNVDPDVRSNELRLALETIADGKIAALHLQARKNKNTGKIKGGKTQRQEESGAKEKKATSGGGRSLWTGRGPRAIDAAGEALWSFKSASPRPRRR